ncbi:MAG: hypothetical protein PHS57_02020 [Alphaproteobacteria bacterium]|nr:hypothetical protein [Alphaproteobacteria bacterium]
MIYSQNDLLKLILETQALSIWDHEKGPVFWYAANVPGPFYVNTEKLIGPEIAERMLREITGIVAGTVDAQARAEQLENAILEAFKVSPLWQKLIETLLDAARKEFAEKGCSLISGGERRDWLFSVPFAQKAELPHLYLFKNKETYCVQPVKPDQLVLHVSDLINNAASFFDLWQPTLEAAKLRCLGNVCVNVRGANGLKRLEAAGQKVVSLMTIDTAFFQKLHAADLITRDVFEEIAVFLASSQDWAAKYLFVKPDLFDVEGCDKKDFERLAAFISNDPWGMRSAHEAFFASMEKAVSARRAKEV